MNNTAWLAALTQTINAQNKANFASALVALIRHCADFDCVVILEWDSFPYECPTIFTYEQTSKG